MTKAPDDTSGKKSAAKPKGKPRQIKNIIPLGTQEVSVYATPKISKALEEITGEMTIYHGVRLTQILEAMYIQGQKDGARNALRVIESAMAEAKDEIPHRNPGKPTVKKKAPTKRTNKAKK